MANFNDLPLEPTPQLTDAVFTARGTASGAERQATIADILALGTPGSGDVVGPASSVDETIPVFNGTTGKLIEGSNWKITTPGATLQSPVLPNPSGDAILQRWGGVLTSGGQAGGGLTDAIMGMTRDIAGPGSTKLTDNWGLTYNKNNVAGSPRYGWNFETVYDVSMAGGSVESEVYLEHRIDNGSGGAAAGSVVGSRPLQWNISLPTSFATDPTAAATVNTATGRFPGYVGLIGVINSFSIQAYDSAGAARATWAWATSAANAGITIASSTGYTYQRFSDWGSRANNDENSIVGDATATLNIRNTATGFGASNGSQFVVGASQHLEVTNFENSYMKLRTNGGSFNPLIELSPGQRVFIGYNGAGISDTGAVLQVKGSGLITSAGDTTFQITGGNYPGLKITSTGLPSSVDFIAVDTTNFMLRVNDNKPFLIQTNSTSRLSVHTTVAATVPITTSSATASTNTTTGALIVTGGVGVGGALNLGTGLSVANGNVVITKSSLIGSGITMVGNVSYTAAPTATDQPFGWVSTLTFNGSATPSGAEHGVASTGVFADTSLNRHAGIGMEGKVNATGLATTYTGMAGDVGFIGSAFSGTLYGFAATRMSITTDGTTPLAQGTAVGLYIPPFVGGATKYGIFSHESIRVHNTVTAYSTAGSGGTYLAHNGTDGDFGTLSGSMYFTAAAGAGAILLWGAVVAPIVDATPLGANTNRWLGAFSSGTYWGLAASVTPANNSDMMVQLTSNTSLTFKVKGTDGTVRSVSLVLV